jgi:membrane AbrB-like protein
MDAEYRVPSLSPVAQWPYAVRAALTLLIAWAAAELCVALRTPIPWMIGPLLVTGIVSVLRGPTESWAPLRNAGQWTIGTALGLYFTPQVTALVGGLWWAILAGIVWALVLGWGFSAWLHRRHAALYGGTPAQQRATSYFAGAIGGASEMTLLAEREGARTDLVAASHSLRLLVVTVSLPFAFTFSGLQGIDLTPPGPREAQWPGLAWLALCTLGGIRVMMVLRRANPWFMGALVVSMGLTMSGISFSAVPTALTNAAQLFIGVGLGVRFTPRFLHTAPRWLASVALGTVVMIVLCAGFAALLSWGTGIHPATLVLGTSPGGIAEMAITAKVLQLGVPVVTAFQVCRLVAVLVLAEPVFRWLARRDAPTRGQG